MLRRFAPSFALLVLLGAPPASAQDEDPLAPRGDAAPAARPEPDPEPPPPPPPPPPAEDDDGLLPDTLLGAVPGFSHYDDLVAKKDELLPLRIQGWHWFHVRQGGPLASDYGIPGLRGTYFYQLTAYPELETTSEHFPKVGAHVDFRFRDDNDRFRAFFHSNYWLWEGYAWVQTPIGKLKAGKTWKRFGLDWDGVWWGNVPYFDGYKLDPDWGASLESSFELSEGLTLDTYVQYFFRNDQISGALVGGDAESVRRSEERDTVVLRAVPTLTLGDGITLAVGVSAMLGRLENRRAPGAPVGVDDELPGAVAVDATLTIDDLTVYAELIQGWGVVHPTRYLSGGPSNVRSTAMAGIRYRLGLVTFRFHYSGGWDDNPSAWQSHLVGGVTLAITKNIDLYLEYVHWEAHGAEGDSFATFENGYQLVLNWRF